MMDKDEVVSSDSETEEDDDEAVNDMKVVSKKNSVAGKANLETADLQPALEALKDKLMTNNGAEEISCQPRGQKVCFVYMDIIKGAGCNGRCSCSYINSKTLY